MVHVWSTKHVMKWGEINVREWGRFKVYHKADKNEFLTLWRPLCHRWNRRIYLWTDPISPRRRRISAGLHAKNTLWHACIDFLTYSDDHASQQSGLCPSRERSLSGGRGYMRTYRSFPAVLKWLRASLGLPTVPISSGQSRFSAFWPDRIFASVGTIQCPDFPKYKIKVTGLYAKPVNYQSKMKYSLQNKVFPRKYRQTDSQITKCFGFYLQNIILAAGDTTSTTEMLLYIILFCITFVIHNFFIQPDRVRGDSKCSSNLTRLATDASDRSPNKCSIVLNRTLKIPRSFDQRKHPIKRIISTPWYIRQFLSNDCDFHMFVHGTL